MSIAMLWHSASFPPYDGREVWSRPVLVLTRSGDVFKISYFLGSDGENGVWQRTKEMAALGDMGKVIAWSDLPSTEELEAQT